MSSQNFSVRTDSGTLEKIDALAQEQHRSRNVIVNEAIDRYIREETRWQAQIEEGLAAAEAGDFASPEDIDRLFESFDQKVAQALSKDPA